MWDPLLDLIPEIERTKDFGKSVEIEEKSDCIHINTVHNYNKVVIKFQKIVYDIPIIIDFGWGSWDEGRKMTAPDFNLDTVDIPTKCKLITAIVRNDRFCEGALLSHFKSGLILKILKSIKRQFNENQRQIT